MLIVEGLRHFVDSRSPLQHDLGIRSRSVLISSSATAQDTIIVIESVPGKARFVQIQFMAHPIKQYLSNLILYS